MNETGDAGQRLILRTDGASRGNPGPAAAGIVVQTAEGEAVAREKHYLGIMTNNQAEYRALILGLQLALTLRPAVLLVKLDSELVVRQMQGKYKVKSIDLLPLYDAARALVAQLPRVLFEHVPRGENAMADALANRALDEERKR
jgi:ribonuclease HI